MVIKPRDAAVQMLQGNTDLVRHEVGKARVGASYGRTLGGLGQYSRRASAGGGKYSAQYRANNGLRRGK